MASNTIKQNDNNTEQENESSPFMSFLKYLGLGLVAGMILYSIRFYFFLFHIAFNTQFM